MSNVCTDSDLPNSDILSGYDLTSGTNVLATRKTFEPNRDLISTVSNTWNGAAVSPFEYLNDALARRVRRVDNGSVTNDFGYNLRSELTRATMGTNTYGYAYDLIGNRQVATNNAEVLTYLANALNQYTNIADGTTVTPLYDVDGNMTNYGAFAFTWDGENRLVGVASNGIPVAGYAYDYMSRRYQKVVNSTTNTFLYDGWAMIRELVTRDSSLVTNSYLYGLDLSGTLQGAGTIGGILSVCLNGTNAFCAFDANGNLTDLVGADGGAHYEYDPYGNTISKTGALAAVNPFRFSAKYTDDVTGLLYYGHRYYSTELSRWISRDPIGDRAFFLRYTHNMATKKRMKMKLLFYDHGAFRFVDNAPLNETDPIGLSRFWETAWCLLPANRACCLEGIVLWRQSIGKMEEEFGEFAESDNNVINAVKHCTWMCHMANSACCSSAQAWQLGCAHEQETNNPERQMQRQMDLDNNRIGAAIDVGGFTYSMRLNNCFDECSRKARGRELTWIEGLPDDAPDFGLPDEFPNPPLEE